MVSADSGGMLYTNVELSAITYVITQTGSYLTTYIEGLLFEKNLFILSTKMEI